MNNLNNTENVEKRNKEKLKSQKKIIIIVFSCLIAFIAVYFLISMIDWDEIFKSDDKTKDDYIYFYDEALSKDLSADDFYMGLDRSVNFRKESSGFTETITEKDLASYGESVSLIYNLIEYMIIGNDEAYNSCFSDFYFDKAQRQGRFTKQKLYNITIIEVYNQDKTDENGNVYRENYYKLEYMIRHNNGSLRDDMGSDCIKTQHLILTDRSGKFLIDNLYTINYVNG